MTTLLQKRSLTKDIEEEKTLKNNFKRPKITYEWSIDSTRRRWRAVSSRTKWRTPRIKRDKKAARWEENKREANIRHTRCPPDQTLNPSSLDYIHTLVRQKRQAFFTSQSELALSVHYQMLPSSPLHLFWYFPMMAVYFLHFYDAPVFAKKVNLFVTVLSKNENLDSLKTCSHSNTIE